jgi:hypothetical protein
MSFTMQELVDKARKPLNDIDKDRFSDGDATLFNDLLGYANDGILLLRNKRPDLFIGSFAALPEKLAIGDTFPLPAEYVPPVVDYVVARAELHDDEHVLSERATVFFQLANGQI